ncbi:hypothetical protein [Microbacterium sp.]|uniref:hypothetical protein n=1 Tax=Microbacterium sp. TaxID=51671 RepID=UPI0037C85853
MNEYGLVAMRHWQTHRPDAYRQTEHPESFFAWMGEEIATRIATLTPQLEGPDLPGEDHLDKAARVGDARVRARQLAFEDFGITLTPELTGAEWEDTTEDQANTEHGWAREGTPPIE